MRRKTAVLVEVMLPLDFEVLRPITKWREKTSAPTDWKCTYTMITFYQFSNDKWGRSAGCDDGNVFDVTGKSMTKKSGNTHDQVPAWMRRERRSSGMRFRRHLMD